jgi:hypothetical protein
MLEAFRKYLYAFTSLTLVALFFAATTSFGQSRRGDIIVDIPFAFAVANRTLPPGRYVITPIGEATLRIYDVSNEGVIVQIHSVRGVAPEGSGKVVFHRYGDIYFLSEVWIAANGTGSQLYTPSAEKELARHAGIELAALRAAIR